MSATGGVRSLATRGRPKGGERISEKRWRQVWGFVQRKMQLPGFFPGAAAALLLVIWLMWLSR